MINKLMFPEFKAGESAVSIVFHPPEISSGTPVTIVSPHRGVFYAVQLPSGEYHRWFASFELQPLTKVSNQKLKPGDSAIVLTTEGHPPFIKQGMIVKIIKVIDKTYFYDVMLNNNSYHRWLAEFELAKPL